MALLSIKNLHVSIEENEILKGLNIDIAQKQLHVLMGPNGSGKSTLAAALMGKPGLTITQGSVMLGGKDILALKPEDRFKAGLFLAFQNPREIPGVSVFSVLRLGAHARAQDKKSVATLHAEAQEVSNRLGLAPGMLQRALNDGFSGGEKKRAEILQMLLLHPTFAILDEIDSGLDADGVKAVADAIVELRKKQDIGILLITHTSRILHALKPDKVSVMIEGKITREGGMEIVDEIEKNGYGQ